MSQTYVLGIDQGSSGSRAMVLDEAGAVVGYGYQPVARLYPQPDWVEQSPAAISASVRVAIDAAMAQAGVAARSVVGCGITSQRDTVFAWNRRSGAPIGNAITWQDLRTVPLVAQTEQWEHAAERRMRLGQFPGAYCSAMHMAWRMRHDPAFRAAADAGDLSCSLAAGWIVQSLGTLQDHALDYSLCQGMTIFDVRERRLWDAWIDYLNLPRAALPRPVPTLHEYGTVHVTDAHGATAEVPVRAMIADQQAALFGYDCRSAGQAACTHGTNSFVNVCAGQTLPPPGVPKTYLAWEIAGTPTYTLEADTTVTGAAIRWMQEQMGWLREPADLGRLALSVPDTAGVAFVPAFTGFGVPSEDRTARGAIMGMTLNTTPAHIARAFLEALGQQVRTILATIATANGIQVERLLVGGGVSASDAACQIQADVLGIPVIRAHQAETSVRAAALLGGMGVGLWSTLGELPALPGGAETFLPQRDAATRAANDALWEKAVARASRWADEGRPPSQK